MSLKKRMADNKIKILLLALPDWGMSQCMVENLKHDGFDVTLVLSQGYKFKYKNFSVRLKNLYRKAFLRDKSYKQNLRAVYNYEQQLAAINKHERYDYCLVIRADHFSEEALTEAKQRSDCFVSYHYDGLNQNETILNRIPLFDRFFVFDQQDIEKYPSLNLKLANNFYFDHLPTFSATNRLGKKQFYFLGTYYPSRMDALIICYNELVKLDMNVRFEIFFDLPHKNKISQYEKTGIIILEKIIPYDQYLSRVWQADVLLDFLVSDHQGLSFRIFEALGYKKKIITTNKNVLHMDFYHEHNFFVINNNYEDIPAFLEKPYVNIDPDIVKKYSFTGWIARILGIET